MEKTSSLLTLKTPIISREAYRAFISFMFAAAMVAWGITLLDLKSIIGITDIGNTVKNVSNDFAINFPPNWLLLIGGILYGCVLICFYWVYTQCR